MGGRRERVLGRRRWSGLARGRRGGLSARRRTGGAAFGSAVIEACAVVAAALVATGCASGSREVPSPFEGGGGGSGSIRVNAVNNNFNEATVRALYRGERRLGIVPGNGRASFNMPWPAINDLRVRIDLLAGDRFTTNRIAVGPGETVYLTIESPVHRSWLRR